MTARERVQLLTDEGSFQEYDSKWVSTDPLKFDDKKPYLERLQLAHQKTGLMDAFISGKGQLNGRWLHLGVFEFQFMGGSMGVVVGEKVAHLFESASKDCLPVVLVCASGGARMQEGALSLMQMAKTVASLDALKQASIPYISVLTNPTTGGVAASFAMLGDIILAEPEALIGFAGPRVIQQTIHQLLPAGFQRSEFVLKHGFLDRIVHRKNLINEIDQWMQWLTHHSLD